jgi:hypothetical protein
MIAFPAAYSQQLQELIKTVQGLTLTIDSLQKELKFIKEKSDKELQASKDSIFRLDSVNKVNIAGLNKKNGILETEKADLNKQIKKLDKNNIKGLEASLSLKTDTLKLLRDIIKSKDSLIAGIKNESAKKEQEKFKEGQQLVYDKIGKTYQNSTFDSLIKYSTKQSIERDSQLVINNAEAEKKWQALQIYFSAQQLLKEKYDEQKLKNAQTQLNSVNQNSEALNELKKRLTYYKPCTDALKITIDKIIDYDKKFIANDDESQKAKQQKILLDLSSYFHNYRFNYTDFPYLADIILDIMKLKQKDANTNIGSLSSKL